MKRLVFGDDSSPSADVAWLWINSHRWPDWQIEVVTADPTAEPRSDTLERWQPETPRELLGEHPGTSVVHELVRDDPRPALGRLGDRDLLVVGPRGPGRQPRLRLGRTVEALIQKPPMPLLLALHGHSTRRVVVSADGSPHSLAAQAALKRLPWVSEVEVVVVSVPEQGLDAARVADAAAASLEGSVAKVSTLVPQPDESDMFYRTRESVLDVLKSWSADLVVLGSRGMTRLETLRAGSLTTSLAMHASCSVLVAADHEDR